MVQKLGRFGKYLKCAECGATRDAEPIVVQDGSSTSADASADGSQPDEQEACELCGKPMQMKRGRLTFLWLLGYPSVEISQDFEERQAH